jgi:[ribosomal protein S5]-alanine N-acetyltransferase
MNSSHRALPDNSIHPILETERIILREARLSDAADILVFRGDPEVQRFNGPVMQTVQEVQKLIEDLQAEFTAQEGVSWAVTIKPEDTVVGLFGIHHWNHYHRRAEVGYDLARSYWGQRLASEALRAMLGYGFENLNLHRIYARTIADNYESVRLLENIGFQREGTQREYSWEDDGIFHDSAIYGLLRREYTG